MADTINRTRPRSRSSAFGRSFSERDPRFTRIHQLARAIDPRTNHPSRKSSPLPIPPPHPPSPPPITAIITPPALGFNGSLFTKRIIGSPGRGDPAAKEKAREREKKGKRKGRVINEEEGGRRGAHAARVRGAPPKSGARVRVSTFQSEPLSRLSSHRD
jgi:hypothetical protein